MAQITKTNIAHALNSLSGVLGTADQIKLYNDSESDSLIKKLEDDLGVIPSEYTISQPLYGGLSTLSQSIGSSLASSLVNTIGYSNFSPTGSFAFSVFEINELVESIDCVFNLSGSGVATIYSAGIVRFKIESSAYAYDAHKIIATGSVTNTENFNIKGNTNFQALEDNVNYAYMIYVSYSSNGPSAVLSGKYATPNTGTQLNPIMPNTSNVIDSGHIKNSAITTSKLANGTVTTDKLADGAVTNSKIANNSINSSKILSSSISTDKIANGAVTESKLAPSSVNLASLKSDITGILNTLPKVQGGYNRVLSPGTYTVVTGNPTVSTLTVAKPLNVLLWMGACTGTPINSMVITKVVNGSQVDITSSCRYGYIQNGTKYINNSSVLSDDDLNSIMTELGIGTSGTNYIVVIPMDFIPSDVVKISGAFGYIPAQGVHGATNGYVNVEVPAKSDVVLKADVDNSTLELDSTNGLQIKTWGIKAEHIDSGAITEAKLDDYLRAIIRPQNMLDFDSWEDTYGNSIISDFNIKYVIDASDYGAYFRAEVYSVGDMFYLAINFYTDTSSFGNIQGFDEFSFVGTYLIIPLDDTTGGPTTAVLQSMAYETPAEMSWGAFLTEVLRCIFSA